MSFRPRICAPASFSSLAAGDVVFQVILGAGGVQQIAGIADGALADLVRLEHRIHRHAHVFDPVQAVEHAEHIDAGLGGLGDEGLHHVVGVVGVADAVGGAQQHLGHHVGHVGAQVAQALPGAFLQEAVGHVKGRAAPAFDREELAQIGGIGRCHADHVDRPHPGRQQRLVAVAHGGVGDQDLFLRLHPVGDGLRALLFQKVAGAHLGFGLGFRRAGLARLGMGFGAACGLGVAVHGDVGDIGQDLGRAVLTLGEVHQVGRRVDEFGGVGVVQEGRVFQQVDDEFDVRADAPDAKFAQGPVHAGDGGLAASGPRR